MARPPALTVRPPSKMRRKIVPYAFVASAALFILLFAVAPVLRGLQLSFTDTRLLRPNAGNNIGFDNYARLIGSDPFLNSLLTTLVYTVITVTTALVLGTAAALVLNRAFPGRAFARTMMILPWAVPTVAVVLVFRWIYNDSAGIANVALKALGLGSVGWLTDPSYGLLSIVLATLWKITPFVMLVVLAALQAVPDDLNEAARIDGSTSYNAFRFIVLPHIMPTLRVVALLMTIWSFRRFEIIWLLTGGGPADATNTIVINVYRQAFENGYLGYAAAMGVIGLLLSLAVTLVYFFFETRSQQRDRGHV